MGKKLALTLLVGYILFLTILSLIKLHDVPEFGSSFDDKIYHFGAYVLMTLLWYNFFSKTAFKFKIIASCIIAFVYGIIVEVLQGAFTTYRSEDLGDVFANSFGVLFAAMLIFILRRLKLK